MTKTTVKCEKFLGFDDGAKDMAHAIVAEDFCVNENGTLVKRPGLKAFISSQSGITAAGAFTIGQQRLITYVSNGHLYIYDTDTDIMQSVGSVGSGSASLFAFNGNIYVLTGSGYYRWNGVSLRSVEGYAPIIAISVSPDGGGTPYESVNMLTPKRREQFTPDGVSTTFKLAEKNIHDVYEIKDRGEAVDISHYTCDLNAGTVTFDTPPEAVPNGIEVTYSVNTSQRSEFLKLKHLMLFGSNADERVFLWGNPDDPCKRYHSELADGVPSAEYFPVTAYTLVGTSPITDIIQQYDKQLIFTSDEAYYSVCEMKTSASGQLYASFPVFPLNPSKGNLLYGTGCTMNGLPVTLCRDGINVWESTDIETEKNAVCISYPIADMIKASHTGSGGDAKMASDISGSRLFFAYGNKLYVFSPRLKVWYIWNGITVAGMLEAFGRFYINDGDTLYELDETIRNASATYQTPYSSLGFDGLKDICGVNLYIEAGANTEGTVSVSWITDDTSYTVSHDFALPSSLYGKTVKLTLPFYIPLISEASFTFYSPSGKDLTLLSYAVITKEKGGNYGI